MSNVNGSSKGGGPIAGNMKPPASKATVANDTGVRSNESAGVVEGLSARQGFDSEEWGPTYNYDVDGLTGNANERPEYGTEVSSAKKNGKTFDIC